MTKIVQIERIKKQLVDFFVPKCSLSYLKIVQIERIKKQLVDFFLFRNAAYLINLSY